MPGKSTSEDAGINYNKTNRKYYARIYRHGKEYYVGSYSTLKEAREERGKVLSTIGDGAGRNSYTRSRTKTGGSGNVDPWKVLVDPDPTTFANPEHVLRYEVLLAAIEDLEKPESNSVYRGAIDWFKDRKVYPKGYSFGDICGIFRLDSDAVVEALARKLNNKDLL